MMDLGRRQIMALGTAALAAAPVPALAAAQDGRVLSAAEFGAKGDGSSDDTAALQKALDATFSGRDSGMLHIPPGVYRLSRTLRIQTPDKPGGNITRRSGIQGHGATLVSAIEDGSPVVEFVSNAVVRFPLIEGIQIQGSGRDGHGISVVCEKRGRYFYNFCFRDIVVQGCGGDGLRLAGNVFEGQLFNCYFRDNKGNGATFAHGKEDTVLSAVHVYGCVFGQNGGHGASLSDGAYDVGFHGCYFLLNAGYGLAAGLGCTLLSHCGFENNHAKAPGFDKGGAGVRLKVFGTLVGCTAYSIYNQTHLLDAYVTNRVVMIGCTGSGGGNAKGAKLAKLDGTKDAAITVIGCYGGVDATDKVAVTELGGKRGGMRFGDKWDSPNPARLGDYRLWVDGEGRLRMKKGEPTSEDDGRPVGS